MKVIVTGASGFVGWRLVRALRTGGAQAVGTWSTPPREHLDCTDAHASEADMGAES
ncbi:NAD-dependent epimerase/dehydratase family protein [Myxococcus fulvus]|uniref:NAD-dependent epimerase/dehydratase family protein n=1 Tax=Myxococcus fulvus TaxID=33 RepID=UPI0020BE587E|nr:NAD-dependent epimerase/dehydratase family protein [Myxococcus fulvus]MCK8499850.1 sugar nucleotide-binding protein [Myxococcus fulvus]